jgi:NADPH-dependent curcumin reductase
MMRQVVLKARPQGNPRIGDFAVEEVPIPEPKPGEILLRGLWLSLDPYMRLGLDEKPMGGSNGVPLGAPLIGGVVSEIIASKADGFSPGEIVEGRTGWREYAAVSATLPGLRKIKRGKFSLTTALGSLGMPGQTAHAGMITVGRVKAGETVIMSGASGAVGSLAGQIGKILGARVVGIAGGPEKCAAVEALGFDACIDYKAPDFAKALAAAVPESAEIYFENVGGAVTRAALPLLKYGARVPVCGFMSLYALGDVGPGPDHLPGLMRMIMLKGLEIRGFSGAFVAAPNALAELESWLGEGRIKLLETVIEDIANAPAAFVGMFAGSADTGKRLVRLAADV